MESVIILCKYHFNELRFCNMLMGIALIFTVGVILLVVTKLISKSCNQNLEIISNNLIILSFDQLGIICLVSEFVFFIPTVYVGLKILQILKEKNI